MSISLNPRVRFRAVGEQGVVVQTNTAQVMVLNETGLRILSLIKAGVSSERELAYSIAQEYGISSTEAMRDVAAYLTELHQQDIIQRQG